MNPIEKGNRYYNGLPSRLMNDIYDGLIARDESIPNRSGWDIFSLYLAHTCKVIEQKN